MCVSFFFLVFFFVAGVGRKGVGKAVWALRLFLHHLVLVSLSVRLPRPCAVCDAGLGNNKWLDVSGCHVKPGQGHAPLSVHTIATGEGSTGSKGRGVLV